MTTVFQKRVNLNLGESEYQLVLKQDMECYATPWKLWRAAIYCGTLWLPLPLPALFFLPFLILHPIWSLLCCSLLLW